MKKPTACVRCGASFEPRNGGKPQRYCTRLCKEKAAGERKTANRTPKTGPCVVCGTVTRQFNGTALCPSARCKAAREKAKKDQYNAEHREQNSERRRRWYRQHPERDKANRDRRAHGIPKWQTDYTTKAKIQARIATFGGICWICKVAPHEEIDHVKPLSKGGMHLPANLRPACRSCNRRKKDRWPFHT